MILNILFFLAWTVIVLWFGTTRARKAMEVIIELQEVNERNRKVHAENLKNNDEIYEKLKLRSEQNDVLMQTIKILNDKINNEGDELNTIENFSGLLGKQYLYLQDDGTYYNRYTDEQMTAEDAEHWLYGELSSIIHRREQMKRYKNSSPEPKKSVIWRLKSGITWCMVESQGEITEDILEKYFDKVEE